MQCPKHNKKFKMFCITCNKTPVCTRCIAHGADHAEHKLIPSAKEAKEQKAWLSILKTDGDKVVRNLRRDKAETEKEITRQNDLHLEKETNINTLGKQIHDLVDEVLKEELKKHVTTKQQNVSLLETRHEELETNLSKVESMIAKVDDILDESDDFTAIENAKGIESITPLKAPAVANLVTVKFKQHQFIDAFIQKVSSDVTLRDNINILSPKQAQAPIGDQQHVVKMPASMVETSSYKHSTDKGITLIRKSKKTCMIKVKGINEIKWTDSSGQVQNTKTFNTFICSFISTLDDRLLVCCYDKMEILEATLSSVRCVVSTSPLKPVDIGTTKTDNHVVIVVDDDTCSITSSSVLGIIVYNKDWIEVDRRMNDDKGNNLFVRPCEISISSRGTMAVNNATGEKSSHLVILEPNLNLKFRIIGQGKVVPGNKALPDLTTCDKYHIQDAVFVGNDHMIVSEFHSRSIQLLDDQGMVVRILSKYVDIVWSLCIDDEGQLWTGNGKGRVVVYKLQ